MEGNKELRRSIRRFYDLLKKCPDNRDAAHDFLVYLRSLLKIQSRTPLPAQEVMALLKKHKPNVFYTLQDMAEKNLMLGILTDLPEDIETPEERLEELLNI
ncbi:hypothetical protein A4244_08285 [Bacillus badius]|uniref:Uncharacterized protein n=2 Tax=Bacillus badius TaxID=1455 RepID=A0ABR5AZ83_BACBA|nr:hypothetical protein SD78_2065 [Bacillus badius]KIL80022.1 hypothetical protein SD77_2476 [Bacillus badius]KZN99081.1 hypothetical protein A4244_08285 [Bacillus badius]KZR60132.1 hypothetical protein A3781_08025 [Bacillus badius]OCS84019.1 hypothetical protein A6M11_08300 [Bacillus badius]